MNATVSSTPRCHGLQELPEAAIERAKLLNSPHLHLAEHPSPLQIHLAHGLACTAGSALGSPPPSVEACLAAFVAPNKAGLTAGARAWSKHFHRSSPMSGEDSPQREASTGWWGLPHGSVATINAKALDLFWRVVNNTTWRNLHWLPHQVLVYEARVEEGYGMRWSQDRGASGAEEGSSVQVLESEWVFRGFVEPMMEGGHEVGWRH
jgi:hypothetical protein